MKNDSYHTFSDDYLLGQLRQSDHHAFTEIYVGFDMVGTRKMFNGSGFIDAVGFVMPTGAIFKEQNLEFPIPLSGTLINPLLN